MAWSRPCYQYPAGTELAVSKVLLSNFAIICFTPVPILQDMIRKKTYERATQRASNKTLGVEITRSNFI